MKNIKIKTKGMHCTSCEMLVKDSLEGLDGIKNIKASSKYNVVEVEFDEKKVTKDQIKDTIKKEGYKVE